MYHIKFYRHLFHFLCLLYSTFILSTEIGASENPLIINILTVYNGYGMEKDANILEKELITLGHHVNKIPIYTTEPIPYADVNIFIEHIKEELFLYAHKNYFIPNPEWYSFELRLLSEVDLILCRTHQAEKIFQPYNQTYFLGFTTLDKYDETINKKYNKILHAIGESRLKGTEIVIDLWSKHPEFPKLTVLTKTVLSDPHLPNVNYMKKYLPENTFKIIQNSYGIHLCPSVAEGYGNYIGEAMSTGAVVITTNGPPMNEFINDSRFLVDYITSHPKLLGMCYYIDPIKLANVVEITQKMSVDELKVIGINNRKLYLNKLNDFRTNLKNLFANE